MHIASVDLDDVFRALADATRRRLLDRLFARNGQTLNELCDGLGMTCQAVTKHLTLLASAGLVTTLKSGREKLHHLNPVPIHEIAERWIGKYERGRLALLADAVRQPEEPARDRRAACGDPPLARGDVTGSGVPSSGAGHRFLKTPR